MIKSGVFGKAAAGLVVAVLTVGAGSAAAMAATGHKPGEVAHGAAQIVEACKDKVRMDNRDKASDADVDTHRSSGERNTHGIGKCVSSLVSHNRNGERQQQTNGVKDADERKSASPSPKSSQDRGQGAGGGSVGAPGQGGSGNGSSDSNHGHSSGHGHQPSPRPSA